jgi:hypothetical protein
MKGVAFLMLVGGWVIAVGGLLAVDDTSVRMAIALLGLATCVGGLMTLNWAHLETAPWKARRR